MKIILASKSPRRKEILTRIGYEPEVRVSRFDESTVTESDPGKLVMILSGGKAEDIAQRAKEGDVIIAADTVVAVDGKILGKPKDKEEAAEMIRSISGRSHEVYTGVTLIRIKDGTEKKISFAEKTMVHVAVLSEEEISDYVKTGDPMDKAGAYGIQGMFGRHVEKIEGDWYNVMGLPAAGTYQALKEIMK